ncbi:hypothetical protein [Mesorhizobium carmichaelinearum]|uniref:hypothetical protein n=1 Tax=Mesorhizobium carmichaelinearum TaxID=1208188 RepID=UPI001181581E|nr:hypothetical protein [Mesorhizobium carmichaelinearum]
MLIDKPVQREVPHMEARLPVSFKTKGPGCCRQWLNSRIVSAGHCIHCFASSAGTLPSDCVAGFGEGDVQQMTEQFQPVRGGHLAQLVEPADDNAKCFAAGFR